MVDLLAQGRAKDARWRQGATLAVALSCMVAIGEADALAGNTKRECIDTNEQAQIAQRGGRLSDARERLLYCASEACPGAVRADCARMLAEVTEAQPTVVIDGRDEAGKATTAILVYFDGKLVAQAADGREIALDPGAHTLRFELSSGRTREEKAILIEGEKRRRIVADFTTTTTTLGTEPPPAAARAHAAAARGEEKKPEHRGTILPYLFGGVAVVGVGGFTAFAVAGKSEEKRLASDCAPSCTSDQVAPVRRDYLLADVSLGVAVGSLGAALLFAWLGQHGHSSASADGRPRAQPTRWTLDAHPTHGGASFAAVARW